MSFVQRLHDETHLFAPWLQVALGALVVGMPDSGFFLDYEDPVRQFHSGLKFVFEEFNSTSGVDKVQHVAITSPPSYVSVTCGELQAVRQGVLVTL
eukprot:9495579-Pyramimonas_sp.AAC.1